MVSRAVHRRATLLCVALSAPLAPAPAPGAPGAPDSVFTRSAAELPAGILHQAIGRNELPLLQSYLDQGANINAVPEDAGGQTALMMACRTNKLEAVRLLLERGADTTISDKDGYSPMHGAAFHGNAKVVKLLIDHGLDHSEYHDDGFAPLHRATVGENASHTETVRVFLENGVDPKLPGKPGQSKKAKFHQQKPKNRPKHHEWWETVNAYAFGEPEQPQQQPMILPAAMAGRPQTQEVIHEFLLKAHHARMAEQAKSEL